MRLATSPEAWPPMPSATMASRSSTGRCSASSLCARAMPTWVSPAKRTLMLSSGKDVLIAPPEYNSRDDQPEARTGLQLQLFHAAVEIAVDGVRERLLGLEQRLARHRADRLVAAHRPRAADAR